MIEAIGDALVLALLVVATALLPEPVFALTVLVVVGLRSAAWLFARRMRRV